MAANTKSYKIDPFTRTPGIAGAAFVNMHYADKIINSFESDLSSKYVYKIVGLRGSGKSVEYSKIIEHFRENANWCVYTLSAAGNPTQALISALSKENFNHTQKNTISKSIQGNAEGKGIFIEGGLSTTITNTSEPDDNYFSSEAALSSLIESTNKAGKKILIGIDDISKTPEMVRFLSIIGKLLMDAKGGIYLICTSLSKNIEEFSESPSLTFFKRGDSAEIGALDKFEIACMYQKLLNVSREEAVKLSKFTMGYAYAYQVLGSLYFESGARKGLDEIITDFDRIISQDSYDLIWKSLTNAEKQFIKNILSAEDGDVSEIKSKMKNPSGYSSLRDRLIKKHLLDVEERGKIKINLPRFKEYVELWES